MNSDTPRKSNPLGFHLPPFGNWLTILRSALVLVLITGMGATNAMEPTHRCSALDGGFDNFQYLTSVLGRFAPLSETPKGPRVQILMGAIEVGKIPGLTTLNGKPLNLSVGGIGTVMNDTWAEKAALLAQRGIDLFAVAPLMRNISTKGMTEIGTVSVFVEGQPWHVRVLKYKLPKGGHVLFADHPRFDQRFDAISLPKSNIYQMRGVSDKPGDLESLLEKQRVWSALSQATAKIYGLIGANAYIPQDGHIAPASFYIYKGGHPSLTLAPVLHNERYLDVFYTPPHLRDRVAHIWNISRRELEEFFMHGDHVVMTASAIRTAERTGVFTAKSVANNTARVLNRDGLPTQAFPQIDLFARLTAEENFLAASNRPDVNVNLAPATAQELAAEKITDSEVVQQFASPHGYQFGGRLESVGLDIIKGKARAKRAVQKIFGLNLNPRAPLFVSFARLVEQKGLDFLTPNVMRILEGGGQVVVGGPVGDESGEKTQAAFLELKQKLVRERPHLARNFVVIPDSVGGRIKALLLAGHDFFPVPSRYEPCGLTDVESLYNGGQPIAPSLGGLVKGQNTINYEAPNPEDQIASLGQGIDDALTLYYKHHDEFLARQVAAHREDFSLERHMEKVLLNQRIEIYYSIIRELDHLVVSGKMTSASAYAHIRTHILDARAEDKAFLIESLRRIHPRRQTALVKWTLQQQ